MNGQEYRDVRLAMGYSQAELGEALGVSGNAIARRERGERPITREAELALRYLRRVRRPRPTARRGGPRRRQPAD